MTRCLVTFGVGEHADLLEIALPSFDEFAYQHGYDLIVATPDPSDRPPSWWKVPVLQEALDAYSEALWIDSDVVIVDASEDLPELSPGDWQALVEHETNCGLVPNLGVWYLRQPMLRVLDRIWARTDYINHGWWEQAAMLDELGYIHDPLPSELREPTETYARTCFLDAGWNVHPQDARALDLSSNPLAEHRARFMHATQYADRASVMRDWANESSVRVA